MSRCDAARRLAALAVAALALGCAAVMPAQAANKPCSGSKGGISRCEGETFICNDGSASGSMKSCPAYTGMARLSAGPPAPKASAAGEGCSCGDNRFCTGPRGGQYCVTANGSKRYLRK
ncbi:hypothetical protein [Bordetella genomosp. 13]|uniref:hypothetical protein n=1 Tax=Bordetella genomosp. 13 TaxID=463040 RepID=UPI0021B4F010|nr:hypothetical protein [Bordetella genomosp. 13]